MFQKIAERIFSLPHIGILEVDFNREKKGFSLSIPLYGGALSKGVKEYVERREGKSFEPHQSSFLIEGDEVRLVQHVPFTVKESLRETLRNFLKLARGCRKMLIEMIVEDRMLDSHFVC